MAAHTTTGLVFTNGSAATVAARPPSTTAASPPMITRPSWPGRATHNAVSSSGEARCTVFWMENQLPNAPRQTRSRKSSGEAPRNSRKIENRTAAPSNATSGARIASAERRIGYHWSVGGTGGEAGTVVTVVALLIRGLSGYRAVYPFDQVIAGF